MVARNSIMRFVSVWSKVMLGQIGSDEAIHLLGVLAQDQRVTVFKETLSALVQIGSYKAVIELAQVFSNSYEDGVFYSIAVEILKEMNPDVLIPALSEIATTGEPKSRSGAKRALRSLESAEVINQA